MSARSMTDDVVADLKESLSAERFDAKMFMDMVDYGLELIAVESDHSYRLDKFHVSGATDCAVRLYYLYSGLQEAPSRRRYRNAAIMGTAHHDVFTAAFKKVAFDHPDFVPIGVDGGKMPVMNKLMKGETDLTFLHIPSRKIVLADYKTINHASLIYSLMPEVGKQGTLPKNEHVNQIQIYWSMLAQQGVDVSLAYVIYEDKSFNSHRFNWAATDRPRWQKNKQTGEPLNKKYQGRLLVFPVQRDDSALVRAMEKFQRIYDAIVKQSGPPARDHNKDWRCMLCGYLQCPQRLKDFAQDRL